MLGLRGVQAEGSAPATASLLRSLPLLQIDPLKLLGDHGIDRFYLLPSRLTEDASPSPGRSFSGLSFYILEECRAHQVVKALSARRGEGLGSREEVVRNLEDHLHGFT